MQRLLLISLVSALATAAPNSNDKEFADCIKDVPVKFTSDEGYAQLAKPFNLRTPFKPYVIALPEKEEHVQDVVKCGAKYKYKVNSRGGGHSYNAEGLGGENGHVVVDLQNLHDISYDKKSEIATVGGGARLGNIADAIYKADKRAIPHGTCPPVGVGGHSLHGGFGISSRMWGLMLDNIVELKVVTADGKLQTASKDKNTDLFWAMRGAGPSFGIVTEFKFKTHAATEDNVNYSYDWAGVSEPEKMADIYHTIAERVKEAPKELGAGLSLFGGNGSSIQFSGVYYGKSRADFDKLMNPILKDLPAPSKKDVHNAGWVDTLKRYAGGDITLPPTDYDGHDTFFAKSLSNDESEPFTKEELTRYFKYANNEGQKWTDGLGGWFVIANLYGGGNSAISNADLLKEASYPHRSSEWVFQFYGTLKGEVNKKSDQELRDFIGGFVKSIGEGRKGDTAYANYQDPTLSRAQAMSLYYGESVPKLQEIKAKFDKQNIFMFPQGIEAAGTNTTDDDPSATLPAYEVPTGTAAPTNAAGGNENNNPTATSGSESGASSTESASSSSSAEASTNGAASLSGQSIFAAVMAMAAAALML